MAISGFSHSPPQPFSPKHCEIKWKGPLDHLLLLIKTFSICASQLKDFHWLLHIVNNVDFFFSNLHVRKEFLFVVILLSPIKLCFSSTDVPSPFPLALPLSRPYFQPRSTYQPGGDVTEQRLVLSLALGLDCIQIVRGVGSDSLSLVRRRWEIDWAIV